MSDFYGKKAKKYKLKYQKLKQEYIGEGGGHPPLQERPLEDSTKAVLSNIHSYFMQETGQTPLVQTETGSFRSVSPALSHMSVVDTGLKRSIAGSQNTELKPIRTGPAVQQVFWQAGPAVQPGLSIQQRPVVQPGLSIQQRLSVQPAFTRLPLETTHGLLLVTQNLIFLYKII